MINLLFTTLAFASMNPQSARMPVSAAFFSQEMRDAASAQLAKLLGGRALECRASADASGIFPISLRATDKGSGRTELSIVTKSRRSFSTAGESFEVQKNARWFIIKDGAEKGRSLYLSVFNPANPRDISGIVAVEEPDGALRNPRTVDCSLK